MVAQTDEIAKDDLLLLASGIPSIGRIAHTGNLNTLDRGDRSHVHERPVGSDVLPMIDASFTAHPPT